MKERKDKTRPISFSKVRIAPTPSGWLHAGNGFSFVLTALLASKYNAELLLRIDDLDRQRLREEYLEDIFDTLEWLGITPDTGPSSMYEFKQKFSQHLRIELYEELLKKLLATEKLFACSCSRKEIREKSDRGLYTGTCREKKLPWEGWEHPLAWRMKTSDEPISIPSLFDRSQEINLQASMPDFVVRKKDGIPAYQIASLTDDIYFGTDLIVRGEDLLTSTAAQLYLAHTIGATSFSKTTFYHHPLLKEGGEKLSKSLGATDLRKLRETGTAKRFYKWIATSLGQNKKASSLSELQEEFNQNTKPLPVRFAPLSEL